MSLWKQLWTFVKPHQRMLYLSGMAMIASSMLFVAGTMITKVIIDDYIMGIFEPLVVTTDPEANNRSVAFDGLYYTRLSDSTEADTDAERATISLTSEGYIMVNGDYSGTEITTNAGIAYVNGQNIGPYVILSGDDVWQFFSIDLTAAIMMIALNFLIYLITAALSYYSGLELRYLASKVVIDLREAAFLHLQELPIQYFSDYPDGKVVSYIVHDSGAIIGLFENALLELVRMAVQIVTVYIGMFILNAQLATYALVAVPVIAVWIFLYRRYAAKNFSATREIQANMNAMMNEQFSGIEVVQAFGAEQEVVTEFDKQNTEYLAYRKKFALLVSLFTDGVVHTLRRSIITIVLVYFGYELLGGMMVLSIGVVYAFVQYIDQAFQPLFSLFGVLNRFERSSVSAQRIFDFFLNKPGAMLEYGAIPEIDGNIDISNLNFSYDGETPVLKDISLQVKAGQTIGIVGHTGSGKSSLMNVLLRFYPYQSGEILIDGHNLLDLPVQSYREHVGIVLQDPILFSGTLFSNISLDNPNISEQDVLDVIHQIGADAFIQKQEKGLQEPVHDMGKNFSVGERQLIAFARVMIYNPRILVLDEATANIDTETETMIQQALQVISRDRTTFIIAHRLSTIKYADQIIVLDKGIMVEKGTHNELLADDKFYRKMYDSQMTHPELAY